MTHEHRKSDSVIVAEKPVNKADKLAVEQSAAEAAAAEAVEPRAETKENAEQQSTCRTQGRESVSQALDRIRRIARTRKQEKFTALLHHISVELLEEAFLELKMKAAAGVDGLTWDAYEADFDRRIEDLHARVHSGAYRALPSRRVYIPKPDGRQRPLAIAALEDKIVQRAAAAVLNAIYEEDFLGFSYGFRPGRGAHDAMDALVVGIERKKVNYILDADIRSFFARGSRKWVIKGGDLAPACQHPSAPCARPLRRALATARGRRRHDHRAVCRRLHCRLPAREVRQTLPGRIARGVGGVFAVASPGEC